MHPRGTLRHADSVAELPRLGGMARPDGVVIVSERFWAFAGTDGRLLEGTMPRPSGRLRRVPLARGLARLALSVSPLFRRGGVTKRRERRLLALAMLGPFTFFLLPSPFDMVASIAVALGLVAWLFRGRTLQLHGAEHRAIAAAEERRLDDTWEGAATPSRFSARCGTNFAALVVPITFAAERFWPVAPAFYTPLAVSVLSLALTMELWRFVHGGRRWARPLLLPGLALQRLTTREPQLEETRVALTALASVLRRELDSAPS